MSLKKKLLLFFSLFILGLVFYFSREIFFYKYEPEYYENLYYHSQWNIPNSTRGISDGELYKFVGYAIVKGENPFDINYEVPPLAKSLYGLAELTIANPYWLSILLYLLSVVVVYKLLLLLTKRQNLSLSGALLFASTPYVATQVKETMLDLPLMFFYLVQTYFFVKFISTRKIKDLALSGVFLGLASATKLPVYTPFAILLGAIFVFLVSKNIFKMVLYPLTVFAGYIAGYFIYFVRHPNPIPWIRLHQKIIDFYSLGASGTSGTSNQLKGVLTASIGDWSPLLVVGVFAIFYILLGLSKKDKKWIYISLLSLVFLSVNSFLPFFPRYLMPVIPLFVVLAVLLFKKARFVIISLIFLNLPFMFSSLAQNNPQGHAEPLAKYISTRAYRELYRSIRDSDKKAIGEQEFIDTYEKFLTDLGTRGIKVDFSQSTREGNSATYKYTITYDTRYGKLVHEPTFRFEKKFNQWKLVWNWDYLWDGLVPGVSIEVNEGQIPLYQINSQGGVLATRANGKEVYVIPRVMLDWTWHLGKLSQLTGERTLFIDERIKSVIPDHFPRFVGYFDPRLNFQDLKDTDIPGVTFKDVSYLKIAPGKLSTEYELENFYKFLQENDQLLDVQADIFLKSPTGEIITEIKRKGTQENRVIEYIPSGALSKQTSSLINYVVKY